MSRFSQQKGARGERLFRDVCRAHGYDADRAGQYQRDIDIADVIGLPGVHIECKFSERVQIRPWMEQSCRDAARGELPIVAHKRSREPWLVTMRVDDWFRLYEAFQKGAQ